MKAELLLRERRVMGDDVFVELRVWRVPKAVRGSSHRLKYSLVLIVDGACLVRYDNEAGKGDHRHVGGIEAPYRFVNTNRLLEDFWKDVERWLTTAGR